MNIYEQTTHLDGELKTIINRYASEYDLPYAAAVGVLVMRAIALTIDADGDSGDINVDLESDD